MFATLPGLIILRFKGPIMNSDTVKLDYMTNIVIWDVYIDKTVF